MNIAMTGATGYIGKHLSSYLTEKGGHRVIPLGRSMFREGMSGLLIQTLAHCDVVINLAGAPINKVGHRNINRSFSIAVSSSPTASSVR